MAKRRLAWFMAPTRAKDIPSAMAARGLGFEGGAGFGPGHQPSYPPARRSRGSSRGESTRPDASWNHTVMFFSARRWAALALFAFISIAGCRKKDENHGGAASASLSASKA